MKKERVKQINTDAIIKVQNFLSDVESKVKSGTKFSIYKLARSWKISGSIGTMCIEWGFVIKGDEQGVYELDNSFDNSRKTAKLLIESLRLKKFNQEKENNIKTLVNSGELAPVSKDNSNIEKEYVPKIDYNAGREIESMLKRVLSNNHQINNQSLFSEQEKEFDDKLKIACAVTTGVLGHEKRDLLYKLDNKFYCEKIVEITNDIYSKLKNNK